MPGATRRRRDARDAPAFLWQTVTYLVVALGLAASTLDWARLPGVLAYGTLALAAVGLAAVALRSGHPRASAACILTGCVVYFAGLALTVYALLLVVTPASVGLPGLLLGCTLCALLMAATSAALEAGRALWVQPAPRPQPEVLRTS